MTDTASLVSRLRANAGELTSLLERSEAADTIEAQAAEIARLREFAEYVASWPIPMPLSTGDAVGQRQVLRKRARAALKDTHS
jgi:hypothetical protein